MTSDEGTTQGASLPPYTRTGDTGETTIGDLSRVPKSDARLEAYAVCEEANAAIGQVIALSDNLPEEVLTLLALIQNDLFDLSADLTAPRSREEGDQLRIDDGYIERLEKVCDHHHENVPPQHSFILPTGTVAGAMLYSARTVVRRAERRTWAAIEEHPGINRATARYLNRLSDLLFVLARKTNAEHGDTAWQPGLSLTQGLRPEAETSTEEE